MDTACLEHRLTAAELRQFEEQGYLVVPQALSASAAARLTEAVDRLDQRARRGELEPRLPDEAARRGGLAPHLPFVLRNFVPEDPAFLELVDHPVMLPKVWGILGFNIYLYHAHLGVTPPLEGHPPDEHKRFHQDSGRVNRELQGSPRSRLSVKVGYFLEGVNAPGNGNLCLVPGSHLRNEQPRAAANCHDGNVRGAVEVCVEPGTAVMFDRRIWHSKSPNSGNGTRKVLFCGYAYRWMRTKDEMTVGHLLKQAGPIQRQLLGDGTSADGYYSPRDEDVPLRKWLEEHDPTAV
jgi:ectoine hydroxylase-related dioxygenase (phytanoyl-CoA dioxygenase family)